LKRIFSEWNFSGFQTRGFWKGKGWSLANFSCSFQWRGPPGLLEGPRRPVNAKSLNLLLAWLVFSYQEGGWTETPRPNQLCATSESRYFSSVKLAFTAHAFD
jgi:hypothetical protein